MLKLWPFQERAVSKLREAIAAQMQRGNRSPWLVLVSPTASGKTVMASHVIELATKKGKSVLFLAHRKELIYQASDKLEKLGVEHGVILAGETGRRRHAARVQVASKDTLHARVVRRETMSPPPADLIVVDECHHTVKGCKTWTGILDLYPNAIVLGLTATPARGDGQGLGDTWHSLICAASYSELLKQGCLVPTRIYAPSQPDLTKIKTVAGDYHKGQLEERMDRAKLVGDIVRWWKKLAIGRPTVVFASGVRHSMHITEQFQKAGFKWAHLDGETPPDERAHMLSQLATGALEGISNPLVLTEGWDCPCVSCAILARPTKSQVLYRQCAGRIQRQYPGKADALLIDHAGAVYYHGAPDEDIEWALTKGKEASDRERKERAERTVTCKACHAMYAGQSVCPECGEPAPKRTPKPIKTVNGSLVEVDSRIVARRNATPETALASWMGYLHHVAREGHTCGRAAHMYRGKWGIWPSADWNLKSLATLPRVWRMPAQQWLDYLGTKKLLTDS